MPELTLSHLHKRFGQVSAVEDLSICVPAGQRLVILGPSGCGKTTTLRLVAGLEDPDGGFIRLGEHDLNALAPSQRGVSMVFQDAALYPHLSVRKNLAFALSSQRLAAVEIAARISETAAVFEITPLLDRYPPSLSGGQRSRVAFARAIVKQPAVLLLDEPLSGLDPPLRWQLQKELLSWHGRFPTTTLHVTHDQQEAMVLGDVVAVMRAGRIEQIGTPMELYRKPTNRFVAGFIGSPGMNFVSGIAAAGRFYPATPPGTRAAVAGEQSKREGNIHLRNDQPTIPLPQAWHASDGPIDLGVRPEAIGLVAESARIAAAPNRLVIDATIESLRPNGAMWLVSAAWAGNLWWVSCDDGQRFHVGERIHMLIDPQHLHCFSAACPSPTTDD